MIRLTSVVAALALCACGKSKRHIDDPPPTTKLGEAAQQKTTAPAVAPQKAAARGPEHAGYSLVDNRLSAHLTRGGGLVLDAGSAGFAKYTRMGNVMKGAKKAWDLRQTEGDIKVAKINGKSATVLVPLAAAQVAQGTDRIRAIYPKARPETPNWDKLAETSTLFMNNYVHGNESQVSHASIWSSNYLAKPTAIEMHDKLADKWMTIDEVAKKAGKYTAGASGNGYIRPARGFGLLWNQIVNHIEQSLGLK